MSYSPFQARGRDGKWVARGANAVASAGAKRIGGKRAKKPQKLSRRSERGQGFAGLKANTVPYVRANKLSQTVGINAGTIIPGTNKRIVIGGYARVESTTRHTALDRKVAAVGNKVAAKGTRRRKVSDSLRSRFVVNNPAIRGVVAGQQVRLGTSRMAGPTIIARRGKHKSPQPKSARGVQKYDSRMRTIAGKKTKKVRAQRRKR